MRGNRRWALWAGGVLLLACAGALLVSPWLQFLAGGALVNLGFRLQDHLHTFDLVHEHDIGPQDVWHELQRQNQLAASVRKFFPRSTEHPVIALLVCMDARIDTSELVGDTRRYYYVVRTAGSALGTAEQEMLELAVINGVRLIVLTTHTDCAAERAAATAEQRARFPSLMTLLDDRERAIQQFKARPVVAAALSKGELLIKRARIDTDVDELMFTGE